jgi:5-(carboxyamino)imidazole ribonucleotide mutase
LGIARFECEKRKVDMSAIPTVSVVLGSKSDEGHVEATTGLLDRFGVCWEKKILSAHRQSEKLHEYVRTAQDKGVKLFIAAAGLSAALPGVIGSITSLPVIGLPIPSGTLKGIDALLSMVQMPGGIPVATVGLGSNGSKNAAVLAAQILALSDDVVAGKLREYRDEMKNA